MLLHFAIAQCVAQWQVVVTTRHSAVLRESLPEASAYYGTVAVASYIAGNICLQGWIYPRRRQLELCMPCRLQESLECIKATVGAALAADMPPSCSKVIYLCDDGKDKAKEAYVATLKDAAV